jgi:hypothetical protein
MAWAFERLEVDGACRPGHDTRLSERSRPKVLRVDMMLPFNVTTAELPGADDGAREERAIYTPTMLSNRQEIFPGNFLTEKRQAA